MASGIFPVALTLESLFASGAAAEAGAAGLSFAAGAGGLGAAETAGAGLASGVLAGGPIGAGVLEGTLPSGLASAAGAVGSGFDITGGALAGLGDLGANFGAGLGGAGSAVGGGGGAPVGALGGAPVASAGGAPVGGAGPGVMGGAAGSAAPAGAPVGASQGVFGGPLANASDGAFVGGAGVPDSALATPYTVAPVDGAGAVAGPTDFVSPFPQQVQVGEAAAGGLGGAGGVGGADAGGGGGIGGFFRDAGKLLLTPQGAFGAAGLASNILMGNRAMPGEGAISATAARLGQQSEAMQQYLTSGTLPQGLQSGLTSAGAAAKATIRSRHASSGTSGSSAEQQELASVDSQMQTQGANMALSLYQTGLNEAQISSNLYRTILQGALQQDQALGSAIGRFASSLAPTAPTTTINLPSGSTVNQAA